jgi:septal ring factor EnvC (AmiA/AmiB activator)
MYRMLRQNPLEALLSAQDFAALMWRARAMTRLLDSDLRLLADVRRAVEFQQHSVRELNQLTSVLDAHLAKLKAESARASRHKQQLTVMVGAIGAQAVEAARVVHELEAADRELSGIIAAMNESETTGFGALKGRLPLPADGAVEVGFGKVVNPRFNTVTVQKGLDIRAAEGSPVVAIAPGKVVFAGWLRGYGNLLVLDHGGGYHSLMAHLAELGKAVGDPVQTGELLGTVGDTGSLKGAYLYFELRKRGQAVDPAPWLGKRK